ncbi:hypothetical protein E4T56_gene7591, partial [Termitomyces sp. T112]
MGRDDGPAANPPYAGINRIRFSGSWSADHLSAAQQRPPGDRRSPRPSSRRWEVPMHWRKVRAGCSGEAPLRGGGRTIGGHPAALERKGDVVFPVQQIDQVANIGPLHAMFDQERPQILETRGLSVLFHHGADHRRIPHPGHAAQFHRRLGRGGPRENPAAVRDKREDMAGRNDVLRPGRGRGGNLHRPCPIGGGNPGGDPLPRLDGGGKRSARPGQTAGIQHGEPKPHHPVRGDGKANQPPRMTRHEVD